MTDVGAAGPGRSNCPQGMDDPAHGGAESIPAQGGLEVAGKPAIAALGIDVSSLAWQRPGETGAAGTAVADPEVGQPAVPAGGIEVAMARRDAGGTWVLVRVAADPAGRVLVYDQLEWECFLDGVRKGEFD